MILFVGGPFHLQVRDDPGTDTIEHWEAPTIKDGENLPVFYLRVPIQLERTDGSKVSGAVYNCLPDEEEWLKRFQQEIIQSILGIPTTIPAD